MALFLLSDHKEGLEEAAEALGLEGASSPSLPGRHSAEAQYIHPSPGHKD